jgi:hypothetical protein
VLTRDADQVKDLAQEALVRVKGGSAAEGPG